MLSSFMLGSGLCAWVRCEFASGVAGVFGTLMHTQHTTVIFCLRTGNPKISPVSLDRLNVDGIEATFTVSDTSVYATGEMSTYSVAGRVKLGSTSRRCKTDPPYNVYKVCRAHARIDFLSIVVALHRSLPVDFQTTELAYIEY